MPPRAKKTTPVAKKLTPKSAAKKGPIAAAVKPDPVPSASAPEPAPATTPEPNPAPAPEPATAAAPDPAAEMTPVLAAPEVVLAEKSGGDEEAEKAGAGEGAEKAVLAEKAGGGEEVTTASVTVEEKVVVEKVVVEEKVVMEVTMEEKEEEEEDPEEEVEPEEAAVNEEGGAMDTDQSVKNTEQKPGGADDVANSDQPSGGDNNILGCEDEDNEEDEEDPSMLLQPLLTEKKEKDFEIFVGKLDKSAVEDDLTEAFGVFGEIQSVRIIKHSVTQQGKGFGFVRYANLEDAKKALAELKGVVQVKGKEAKISVSNNNDTLYMGHICKTWSKDKVMDSLKALGVDQLERIVLPDDPKNEGRIKGYALLQYTSHNEAMAAFQRLRMPDAVFGCDKSAKVAFSTSLHPSEESMSKVKSVYVDCIPESWDENKVKELCGEYGEIEKVRLSRDFKTRNKKKDFGFVDFTSHESAVSCVEGLNGAQLGEGEMKVKANLAKPQNKGRQGRQLFKGGFPVDKDGVVTEDGGQTKNKTPKLREDSKGKAQFKSKGTQSQSKSETKVQTSKSQGKLTPGKRRVQRGNDSVTNERPSKKSRNNNQGNRHSRPSTAFGHQRTGYMAHPTGYGSGYPLPPASYQAHAYAGPSGSYRHSYDLEPHGGYLPAARASSYVNDPRRSTAYANHPSSGSGYGRAAEVQPPYHRHPSYPGYEGAYAYPSSGAYDPRRGYY